MKARLILLYVAFACLLLFLLGVLIWPFLRVDERLRDILAAQIDPTFAGDVEVRHVHLGFSALKIQGLSVLPEDQSWQLQADEISVGFSLLRFLASGLKFSQALTSVSIQAPIFSLPVSRPDTTSDHSAHPLPQISWDLVNSAPAILWIREASIEAGQFRLVAPDGSPLLSLDNLSLRLASRQTAQMEALLQSRGRGSQSLSGSLHLALDARARTLDAQLQVRADSMALGKGIGLPGLMQIAAQKIAAALEFHVRDSTAHLDGELHGANLSLSRGEVELVGIPNLDVTVQNWRLRFAPAPWHNSAMQGSLQGEIADLRHPILDLSLTANCEQGRALESLWPATLPVHPDGQLELQAVLAGELMHPALTLEARLERLDAPIESLSEIHVNAEYADRRLILNLLNATSPSGRLEAQGQMSFAAKHANAQADIIWQGKLPHVGPSKSGKLQCALSISEDISTLSGSWQAADSVSPKLTIQAEYLRGADSLTVSLQPSMGDGRLSVSVNHLRTDAYYDISLDQPQAFWDNLLNLELLSQVRDLQIGGEISGRARDLTCRLLVLNEKTTSRLKLDGALQIAGFDLMALTGNVMLRQGVAPPLEGQFSLAWQDDRLILKYLQLDGAISAHGELDVRTGELGPTELRLSNWPLARGMQIFLPDTALAWGMSLDGRLEAYGNIKRPSATLDLYASQGYYRERGDFWAVVSAKLEDNHLTLDECNIGQGILSLLRVQGQGDLTKSTLDFTLQSDLQDAADLVSLFSRNPMQLRGPLKISAHLGGTFLSPEPSLNLIMLSGSLYHVPFDSLTAVVVFDTLAGGSVRLQNLRFKQNPDLALNAQGVLPLLQRPLDLQIFARGNILKILHQMVPDILESYGWGELDLRMQQVENHIRLREARLQMQGAKLRFPEVVSEIHHLDVDVELRGNQLQIENISGIIDDQSFRIHNVFSSGENPSEGKPLYFSGPDLNGGIINIETRGRGIHAHIPALMPAGVKSYIGLRGKDGQGEFAISGPLNKLHMQGDITVSGAEFTFPFPSGGGPPSRFAREVLLALSSAIWDVNVIPARDNRYSHEIKAVDSHTVIGDVSEILTTVDVRLDLDPGDSHLKVVGALDDDTFRFIGRLVSTRGSVEYLDFDFRVDRFEAEFDEFDPFPMVQGRANTIYMDSTGFSRTIYATLYVVDPVTGERRQRGRWGDFVFVLEDDQGSSQEQILAAMGYSPGAITSKVTSLGGSIVSGVVLRGFVRPIERRLENLLQVDVIRLQPTIAQNLFASQVLGVTAEPMSQIGWGAYILRQSQLTVGKYLTDDIFLSYTGLWKTGINAANERHFGFLHRWNLDYRIRPVSGSLVLTVGYEYDSLEKLEDRKIALRYAFVF